MREPDGLRGADPRRLIGTWRFDRALTDLASGQNGTATGILSICERDGGLTWYEQGELSWGGLTAPVSRELRLVRQPDAADWQVTFADGRPFHPWRTGTVVEHACRLDLYRGRIDDLGEDGLRVEWTVSGPQKHHRYITECRRISRDQPPAGSSGTAEPA